ncbi:MAG: glycosyltransferase [Acidobacteria bacterium]|nr:glycosyltransferase [Acidobacteriota bacterium]
MANVALYYPWFYLKSGGERTCIELLKRSRHRWTIITNRYDREATYPELADYRIIELDKVSVKRTFAGAGSAAWKILTQKLPLEGQDVLLILCDGLGDLATFRNRSLPTLSVCFTPLRIIFDEHYRARYLESRSHPRLRSLILKVVGAAFRTVDRMAWKNYLHVFPNSEETRARIVRAGLCPPGKLTVLRHGYDVGAARVTNIYEPYFLIAGRIMWTKNIELGIDAFLDLRRRRPDLAHFRLKIAGFVDRKSVPYLAMLRERAAGCEAIEFLESPQDADLWKLYENCTAVVYPPFNEDLGLPPIEGMAHAKPVVAVNRGGPRETILHGETGFLLDPTSEAFSRALELLADNLGLVRTMGAAGREHARRFDWSTFTQPLDDFIDRAAGRAAEESRERCVSA